MKFLIMAGVLALIVLLFWYPDPDALYLWVKSLHVIAVIAWMAALLYLPRLFVYHTAAASGSDQSETFKIMERRLMKAIGTPAMLATWIFGLWLAIRIFEMQGGWLHIKILMVVGITAAHFYLAASRKRFEEDRNEKSTRHWRIVNEVPTVLMIAAVVLVIVKPF